MPGISDRESISGNEIFQEDAAGSGEIGEPDDYPEVVLYASPGVTEWEEFVSYGLGDLVSYGGRVYECIYAHTSNSSWLPDGTPTLWKEVSFTVSGPDVPGTDLGSADVEALVNVCVEIRQTVVFGTSAILVILGFLAGVILVRGLGGFLKGV